jgi:hypothetical protein
LHVSPAITLRSASLRCSSSLSRSDLTTTSIPMSNRWSRHWVVVQKRSQSLLTIPKMQSNQIALLLL